jgi:hypothetical protein
MEKFFGPDDAKQTMNFSEAVLEKNPELRSMLGDGENTISFKDLRGLRSEIAAEIRKEKGYPSPNEKKIMRLGELGQSVQRTLDQLGNKEGDMVTKPGFSPELRGKYEGAVKAYREDYVPYKQGATRDVLRAGATGEEPATPYSAIAGKFFKSGRGAKESAQEFIKNVGSREDAAEALKDYAYRDLADFATDPNTGKLNSTKFSSWFKSRQEALSEFPELKRDLFNIKTAQKKVDELSKVSGYFDGDPEKTMQRVLTSKNPRGEMDKVRRLVQDDPEALNGLKQGFWTDAMEKAKTRRLDIGGEQMLNPAAIRDHMKKYSSIYDRLYEPQEKANLEKVQKAYETIMRSDKTPLGTGSDTAENMNIAASLAAWAGTKIIPGAGTSLFLMGSIRKAVNGIGKGSRKALLEQALINPEIAKDLITMSKSGPSKAVMKRLNAHLVNLPYAGEEE